MTFSDRSGVDLAFLAYVERRQAGESIDVEEYLAEQSAAVLPELRQLIADYEALRLGGPESTRSESVEFGEYLLQGELGRGASAVVWEAVERPLDRRVALKRLHPIFSFSDSALRRFLREARAVAGLDHPGIIKVFATGEVEGVPFISQELVPGGRTLTDWLGEQRRAGPFGRAHDREVARLVMLIADALACANKAGVVHRDLKPSNILMTPEGMPKVADFGLALVRDDQTVTRSNDLAGTYAYMSPEQVRGAGKAIDQRSDIFALGTILHELLTGARPFPEQSALELRASICEDRLRDPRVFRSEIPAPLAAICIRALRRNPESRYQAMGDLAEDLRAFREGRQVSAHSPGRWLRAWYAVLGRPRLTAAISGVSATALASLGLLLFVKGERDLVEFESRLSSELLLMQDELHLPQDSVQSRAKIAELASEVRTTLEGPRQVRALEKLGHSARRLGDTGAAIAFFREALEQHALAGSSESPSGQENLRALGWCLTVELRFVEAAELYEQGIARAVPGSLPAELLAAAYVDTLLRGRLEDRLLRYLQEEDDPVGRLVALVERLELERPENRLIQFTVEVTLASLLQFQSRREEARELIDESLAFCESTLSVEHPLRLRVMVAWSKTFSDNLYLGEGVRWAGVRQQLASATTAIIERYGELHPLASLAQFELARLSYESQKWGVSSGGRSADELYAAAGAGFAELGAEHLYSLLLRQHLLNRRWHEAFTGQVAGLLAEWSTLLEDFVAALGPHHSDTLNCRRALMEIQLSVGALEDALESLSPFLRVPRERRVLGSVGHECWSAWSSRAVGRVFQIQSAGGEFDRASFREQLLSETDEFCTLYAELPPEEALRHGAVLFNTLLAYCRALHPVAAERRLGELLGCMESFLQGPLRSQLSPSELRLREAHCSILRALLLESSGDLVAARRCREAFLSQLASIPDRGLEWGHGLAMALARRLGLTDSARRSLEHYLSTDRDWITNEANADPLSREYVAEEREVQRTYDWLSKVAPSTQPAPSGSRGEH